MVPPRTVIRDLVAEVFKTNKMTKEQTSMLSGCVFRSAYLLKMLDYEMNYYSKLPAPSGIKNELHRMSKCYKSGLTNIGMQLPHAKELFNGILNENDERILAMSTIIEKLALMPVEYVLQVENDLEAIKVNYK